MSAFLRVLLCGFVGLLPPLLFAGTEFSDPVVLTSDEKSLLKSFGPWPVSVPADPGNELSGVAWAEVLGKALFNDPSISGDGTLACSTCHRSQQGFTDGLPVAQGSQTHVRNTQGLLDAGLQHWMGWDGGTDSLWAASLRPMLSEIEMAGEIKSIAFALKNNALLTDAFGQWQIAPESDEQWVVLAAKAIAAYTRTLTSAITPFDQFYAGVFSDNTDMINRYPVDAKRGLKIFLSDANCHVCHFGANFSNGEFHDTGRPFFTGVGRIDPGRYSGIKRVQQDPYNLLGQYNGTQIEKDKVKTRTVKLGQINFGQWRTPSLRNLTTTAPYMHDGSLTDLRSVVDAYADIDSDRLHTNAEAILKPLDLSDQDRDDLVVFLRSLSAD